MVHINHLRQVNDGLNWKCGAYSLKMIMDYYGINYTIDDIWNHIKCDRGSGDGEMYAKTYLLAQYAIEHRLPATIHITDKINAVHTLQLLDQKQIPAILSITQPRTGASHFVVYSGIKNNLVQIVDPDEDTPIDHYSFNEMLTMWDKNPAEDVTGFVFIIFGKNEASKNCLWCKSNHPIVDIDINNISDCCICPNKDISF